MNRGVRVATCVNSPGIFLALSGLLGCGTGSSSSPSAEITDSAGVRIVSHSAYSASDPTMGATWSIGTRPQIEIGVEGGLEYELFQVTGAVVLSDGVIVVANRGTYELRFYNNRGRYLRSAGGQGDGPGEFQDIRSIDRIRGDSVLVFDGRRRRASVFDQEGHFARSFSLGQVTESAIPSIAGALLSGRVLVRENHPYIAGMARTGADRSPAALLLSDPIGVNSDTLGIFPGDEMFVMAVPADMWMTVRPVTFGNRLVTAVGEDRIAVATTETFAVRVYDSNGVLQTIIRQPQAAKPVENADVTRFNDSVLATIEDQRSQQHYREMFELMPTKEVFPALASVRIDADRNLWVQAYGQPGEEDSAWHVFNEEDLFAARILMPACLNVLEVGADYVLSIVCDEMGIERVGLYSLDKSQD